MRTDAGCEGGLSFSATDAISHTFCHFVFTSMEVIHPLPWKLVEVRGSGMEVGGSVVEAPWKLVEVAWKLLLVPWK